MNKFPENFRPENKDNFSEMRFNHLTDLMRKNIYHLVIKGNEKDFFDLEIFNRQHVGNIEITKKIASNLVDELHSLGWKTVYSYGDTGLFIYTSEEPPVNAW
jgi:hypothetical protein